ncbi:MAG: hypothetical protein NC238_09330 [Dehalobacter sp.]|nr:hypothetical protein [Dehalobacter sp.]
MWLIWMAAGAFTFFVAQTFNKRLKEKGIILKWYQWGVFVIWYALAFLAIDIVCLSIAEHETRAATIMGAAIIAIMLVLLPLLRKMLNPGKKNPINMEKKGEVA